MISRTGTRKIGPPAILGAICLGMGLAGGCSRADLGRPRVAASEASPDGRYRAFVRNHPSIDPPNQSLWLASDVAGTFQIRKLSEDEDWCRTIAWAGDSQSVAFLVQDAHLVVVDVVTHRIRVDRWLVPQQDYPPSQEVRNVSLSHDGSIVRFTACSRGRDVCADRVEVIPRR